MMPWLKAASLVLILGLFVLSSSVGRSADSSLELLHAIESGNVMRAVDLLQSGADANARDPLGRTALMYAGINGQTHLMKILIDKGADVNAEAVRFDGVTPLIASILFGDPEAIRLLLLHGADVNARDGSGRTALTWAKERFQTAPPDRSRVPPHLPEKNQYGDLMLATKKELTEVIELLEGAGAVE